MSSYISSQQFFFACSIFRKNFEMGMKLETIKVPHEYERSTPVTLQPITQFGRNDSTVLSSMHISYSCSKKIAAVLI